MTRDARRAAARLTEAEEKLLAFAYFPKEQMSTDGKRESQVTEMVAAG